MDKLMYEDYSLWLYNFGYLCDCPTARAEYESWRLEYEKAQL